MRFLGTAITIILPILPIPKKRDGGMKGTEGDVEGWVNIGGIWCGLNKRKTAERNPCISGLDERIGV